ncbi:MAG TPA: hypothetical protein PKH54_09105 [Myxococcota bacterium]|nr:hypothetical protein [Myxococcota bacterium]HOD00094.1 hypothetical protein [Myxococcota bacterium]HOH77150.1 hypothetical protein [Myxococcota bacterium]
MKKFFSLVAVFAFSSIVIACGDSNNQPDTSGDDVNVNDVSDIAQPDVPEDTGNDVRPDVPDPDVVDPDTVDPDVVPEIVDDVVEDLGRPDVIQYDGFYVPNPIDPYEDVLPKDVDWQSLPKMPAGKTFTTRYAAGVGITSITPDFVVYLGGFGNCTANDDGCRKTDLVHDPVEVRAVAFADTTTNDIVIMVGIDNVGLLDFDVVGAHRHVQKKLYESFGIHFPGANAILAFSHAHSSIDTTGLWGPMMGAGRDEAYTAMVLSQIAEACRLAVEDLGDIELSWGVDELLENYSGDPDTLDSNMWVIKGVKPGETPELKFTLTRWAAHPTTYGDDYLTISSDFPGTFRYAMERDFGGKSIYINGPLGDTYPNRPGECGLEEEFFPEGDRAPGMEEGDGYMKATCTGLMVANAAQGVLQTLTPLAETGIEVKHDQVFFHPYNDFLMFAIGNIPLPFPTCEAIMDDCYIYMRYSLVRIGDLTFITAPGEIFPTFAKDLTDIAATAGYPNPMVVFGQGWLGYLMTEAHYNDASLKDLDYHRGLCPGPDLYPKFIESLTKMVTPAE